MVYQAKDAIELHGIIALLKWQFGQKRRNFKLIHFINVPPLKLNEFFAQQT